MESRRIRLLSKAYLSGRLDFKKKFPWDDNREEIILYFLEQEILSEVMGVKAMRDAILASASIMAGNAKNALKITEDSYKQYLRFTLPSLVKKSTMDIENEMGKDNLLKIKEMLAQANRDNKK